VCLKECYPDQTAGIEPGVYRRGEQRAYRKGTSDPLLETIRFKEHTYN